MFAETPHIAQTSDRRPRGNFKNRVCCLIIVPGKRQLANQNIDLRQLKAGDGRVEINVEFGQVLQLKTE